MFTNTILAGVFTGLVFTSTAMAQRIAPSALLTIDQNRATVVDRIVGEWGDPLANSNAGVSAAQLREILSGLRADHLLAASLAGSVSGLRDVLSGALVHTDAAVARGLIHTKSLGDTVDDLVYTPVVPCRIVDSRFGAGGTLAAGAQRDWLAANPGGNFTAQGGSNTNCGIAVKPAAVLVNVTVANTAPGPAFLTAWPYSQARPLASTLNWTAVNSQIANAVIVPLCTGGGCTDDFSFYVSSGTDVIVDVAGYFNPPSGGFVSHVATGPGLTGGPITGTGTISLAASQLLPTTTCTSNQVPQWNGSAWICASTGTVTSVATGSGLSGGPISTSGTINLAATNLLPTVACGTNQIPKWNGSAWACGLDNNSGGTVTSITAGAGLTGGTITGSGTIAVDPTSSTLTSRFFKQGGNAFGVNPTILGTSDSNPLQVIVAGAAALQIQPDAISPIISAGSSANSISAGASGAVIGGGGATGTQVSLGGNIYGCAPICANLVTDAFGTIGGGMNNLAGDAAGTATDTPFATVGGGFNNTASGRFSTVGGGVFNAASGQSSTVAGGNNNGASGDSSTVAGGYLNRATQSYSTVSGGYGNKASGNPSTVPGGVFNVASGTSSFAAGTRAKTQTADVSPIVHDGTFVWADLNAFDFNTAAFNEFAVRATGGVRFVLGIDGTGVPTWTCAASNGNSWACSSDRNLKENYERVDSASVLQRVAALPLYFWNAKGTDPNVRHLGPTAQDFMAAFSLGNSDKMIGMQDADGVALAAIQGLHQMLRQRDGEMDELKQKLQAIEAKLNAM